MTEAVMKTSNKIAPALFLLAVGTAFGFGFVSQVGKVMAEGVVQAVQSVAVQASTAVHATAAVASDDQVCEQREVEADEGYGISRKEMRVVCH
jgi:hypothetical protein